MAQHGVCIRLMRMQRTSRYGSTGAGACRDDLGTVIMFIHNDG